MPHSHSSNRTFLLFFFSAIRTTPAAANKTATKLEFTDTRNKDATDVTIVVEWSAPSLNDWTTSAASVPTILSDNGTTQQIKITVPAGSGIMRRIVHLKVIRP